MAFELPSLPYDYEALQPYMSKETLEYPEQRPAIPAGIACSGVGVGFAKPSSFTARRRSAWRPRLLKGMGHPFTDRAPGPAGTARRSLAERVRTLRRPGISCRPATPPCARSPAAGSAAPAPRCSVAPRGAMRGTARRA